MRIPAVLLTATILAALTTNAFAGPEGVRIPKAFSFEPDDSPLILSSVTSPGADGRVLAARNPNLFRRFYGGGRQAAEIIESDPIHPRPSMDTPAMAPPADGSTHRAEVMLPSSSRGVAAGPDGE